MFNGTTHYFDGHVQQQTVQLPEGTHYSYGHGYQIELVINGTIHYINGVGSLLITGITRAIAAVDTFRLQHRGISRGIIVGS